MAHLLEPREQREDRVVAAAAAHERRDHDRHVERALGHARHRRRRAARRPRGASRSISSKGARAPAGAHVRPRGTVRLGVARPPGRRALERQRALEPARAGAPRASRAPTPPGAPPWCTASAPASAPGGRAASPRSRIQRRVGPHLVSRGRARAERLHVSARLAQAAVLVEVALHELDRAVVVRVAHGGAGMEDLHPARLEHRAAEGLVLGVGERPAKRISSQQARAVAGVHVRQEGRGRPRAGAPARRRATKPAKNSVSSRAIIGLVSGVRQVRAEGGPHARVELERLAVGGEPARASGTASWVRKQISSPRVRSAPRLRVRPWPNSRGRDLDQLVGPAARAISCDPSREPESITTSSSSPWARTRLEHARRAAGRRPSPGSPPRRERTASGARARTGPGCPRRARAGRARRATPGVSLASSHSGVMKAVPQSGFATPWSPASPNSARVPEAVLGRAPRDLRRAARASAAPRATVVRDRLHAVGGDQQAPAGAHARGASRAASRAPRPRRSASRSRSRRRGRTAPSA